MVKSMAAVKTVPVVSAIGLTKEFRDFWNRPKAKAVNDIDFEVCEGEVIGLLGPNGSGKSTTVKMILGLLYPTAGKLSVLGNSPRDVRTKKEIGYLPEESYLYKYLSAMETLDFFGALFNLSAGERRARSEQLLEMVGLSHAKNRPVGEFSKGMARRIGLAQAMINDPSLLILDEPTSGLDPLGCKEVKDLILLLKKRGKTVIVTSHLLSDVEDVCDRVIILYGGKIRATGTLNELLTIPEESRITTPLLRPEVTEKLLMILRENLKGEDFSVDHPRKTLEEFFLEVVNKARKESLETSGSSSGGHIANYLDSKGEQSSNALLEQLVKDTSEIRPSSVISKELIDDKDFKKDELSGKSELLASLLKTAPEEEKRDQAPDQTKEEAAKLDEVNKKLQNLLNEKKEQ
ncbi:MAG: ABC transporter ATP-binding protein [Lentisphaerae bacterium GWF2_52_8]|nr:MAG: ABC transporter ATP-binding protein [Lentisphaerae bacterium GWF2_52_8]